MIGSSLKVLQSNGVVRYDPVGEAFDPNAHMARFELDDPSKDSGTVGVVTLVKPIRNSADVTFAVLVWI